jgi:signal transduction histidine kinase/ActR/RegA family two-component response regulator
VGGDVSPRSLALPASRSFYAIVAALLLIAFVGVALFFVRAIGVEEREYLAQNDAIARSVAASIEAREQGYLDVLRSYAGRFRFRDSIKQRNGREALVHLRQLHRSFPELDRVFLADPAGVVWVTEPETPDIYGRSYAFRDWYRGVSAAWQPYMSEVYRTDIGDALAVALAVPVHDVDGTVIGIIASVQRLDVLRSWLLPIEIPGGDILVVDRKGRLIFHRARRGAQHLADYADAPAVRRLVERQSGAAELANPVDGQVNLAAYRWLPSLGWGVVVQRTKNVLLQRMRTLILLSAGLGFALAATLAALGAAALRNERRTAAALARSSERLKLLHEIDRAMIAARAPVEIAETVLPRLRDLLDVPRAIVSLFDIEAEEVEWLAAVGRRQLHIGPGVRFPLRLMGDLGGLRRGEPQIVDTASLPQDAHTAALAASGVHTYMVVPMIVDGDLIGAVSFGGTSAVFSAEQMSIAQEVAAQLAIALTQARLRERVERHAEELEQRVKERTLELASANGRLQAEIDDRRRAEEAADRANRAKSEFLSRMSHELRTPLNGIIGFAQLLELESLDGPQRESVDQILKGGRHLLGLINEVLDLARIEAGKLAMSPEPVLLKEVVRAAIDMLRPQAASRRITVVETVDEDRYAVADRQRLQQVLLNLLSNAIKYNTDGGRVHVACEAAAGGRVRLTVTDTGRGIETAMLERLFKPFDRLGAEQTAIEGTGLGLALSQRLVEAMGGVLSATSTPARGTTFIVELEAASGDLSRDGAALMSETSDDGEVPVAGTVLYIEDNLSNLRLLERIIARRPGVTLLSAMQGSRGLELARDHRPDLIILDLHLPDLAGGEVLARLQADPDTKAIPVVILTADATSGQRSRLLEQGARAYLTKPLDVRQLLTLVDDTLRERRSGLPWAI